MLTAVCMAVRWVQLWFLYLFTTSWPKIVEAEFFDWRERVSRISLNPPLCSTANGHQKIQSLLCCQWRIFLLIWNYRDAQPDEAILLAKFSIRFRSVQAPPKTFTMHRFLFTAISPILWAQLHYHESESINDWNEVISTHYYSCRWSI